MTDLSTMRLRALLSMLAGSKGDELSKYMDEVERRIEEARREVDPEMYRLMVESEHGWAEYALEVHREARRQGAREMRDRAARCIHGHSGPERFARRAIAALELDPE